MDSNNTFINPPPIGIDVRSVPHINSSLGQCGKVYRIHTYGVTGAFCSGGEPWFVEQSASHVIGAQGERFNVQNLNNPLVTRGTSLWYGQGLRALPPCLDWVTDSQNLIFDKGRVLVATQQEQGFARAGSTSYPAGFFPSPRRITDSTDLASTPFPPLTADTLVLGPHSPLRPRRHTGGPRGWFPMARPLSALTRITHTLCEGDRSGAAPAIFFYSLLVCHPGQELSNAQFASRDPVVKKQIPAFAGMTAVGTFHRSNALSPRHPRIPTFRHLRIPIFRHPRMNLSGIHSYRESSYTSGFPEAGPRRRPPQLNHSEMTQ